jgi:hypothetical protein
LNLSRLCAGAVIRGSQMGDAETTHREMLIGARVTSSMPSPQPRPQCVGSLAFPALLFSRPRHPTSRRQHMFPSASAFDPFSSAPPASRMQVDIQREKILRGSHSNRGPADLRHSSIGILIHLAPRLNACAIASTLRRCAIRPRPEGRAFAVPRPITRLNTAPSVICAFSSHSLMYRTVVRDRYAALPSPT